MSQRGRTLGASSSVAKSSIFTPVGSSAARIAGASRPIRTTARTKRRTGSASGSNSWPLPSPPAITTSFCSPPANDWPRPTSAATVAPTLVPLESS